MSKILYYDRDFDFKGIFMNRLIEKNTFSAQALQGFCAALYIFPLSLSVGVLSGVGVFAGAVAGVIGCLSCVVGKTMYAPCWMLFMPAFFMIKEFGTGFAFLSMLLGGMLFLITQFILQKKNVKIELTDAAKAGLALGAAFLATVILTKDYFGIAASGNTAIEMLKSYRSNGFHANWRGVLYGTITLVIMITWPRKFRTFKKYLPAPFMALLIPLVFNMLLNREAYRTPVYETGEYALSDLSALFDFSANTHPWWLLPVVAIGFCVCLFAVQAFFGCEKEDQNGYAVGIVLGSAVCLPLRSYEFGKTGLVGGLVGAVTVVALSCVFPLVSRMPTHSMAVVLITLGWQSVPWGLIAKSFKSGIKDITAVVLVFLCFIFADPVLAFLPPFVSFFDKRKI